MRKASVQVILCFCVGCVVSITAQSENKCFTANWLQGIHNITLTITGTDVTGEYSIISGDGSDKKSYPVTGTLRGTKLTVKFQDDKLPDISPSEMKSTVWTLTGTGAREILSIKVYGKNYQTNKYQMTLAKFHACRMIGSRDG